MIIRKVTVKQGALGDDQQSESYTSDIPFALMCEDAHKAMIEFLPRHTQHFIFVEFDPPNPKDKAPFLKMGYEDLGGDIYWTYWSVINLTS